MAVNYDMATSGNWNIRIDGASTSDFLGAFNTKAIDIDNNGKQDLVIISNGTFNGRASSGAVYIILDSLLSLLSGTRNTIDLATSTNYNLRIDGAAASDIIGNYGTSIGQLDTDGKPDLILTTESSSNNSRASSGSVYVLYNSLLQTFLGTGNTIDLATSTNYNLRFDGAAASCNFGPQGLDTQNADFDNDGKIDLALGSRCDFNARTDSGSLYLVYNTIFSGLSGTGNNIDLATSTNYNLRIDGAVASDRFSGRGTMASGLSVGDLDKDGKTDLVASADGADNNARNLSGSVYVFYNTFLDDYPGTGNTIDLSNTAKFNIRFDGPAASNQVGQGAITIVDFDLDNDPDLFITDGSGDFNGRTDSGSVFFLDYSLFSGLTETANTVDLASSTNYTFRIDGAAGDNLGLASLMRIADFNNDSLLDVGFPAFLADYNSRTDSGSAYTISNSILFASSTVGRTYDLASGASYSHRYDGASGASGGDRLSIADIIDLNSDGTNDFIFVSYRASNNSRTNSGSVYIVYNFPHGITESGMNRNGNIVTIKGSVTAPNSTTVISGIQYQVDTNSESAGWSECGADDGAFNSLTENFTCTASLPNTNTEHAVFVRAYDANSSYTAKSRYLTYREGSARSMRPDYLGVGTPPTTLTELRNVISMVNFGTFRYDAEFEIAETPKTGAFMLPDTNYWQAGSKLEIWWRSWFNGAKILPSEVVKPFTLIFKYDPAALENNIPEKSLRIAYSNDGKSWKIINSILDTGKKQLAIVTKDGGYYIIVGRGK